MTEDYSPLLSMKNTENPRLGYNSRQTDQTSRLVFHPLYAVYMLCFTQKDVQPEILALQVPNHA